MDPGVEAFSADGGPPRVGRLLVAAPALVDPNFAHTVVLILDHDDDGTLGVVLNRPTGVRVDAVLEDWSPEVGEPPVIFEGGPVSPDAALALAALPVQEGGDPAGFRRVHGATGVVDLDAPRDLLARQLSRLRIFAGYAGWGAGQLAAEIAEGSWHVVDSQPTDAFAPAPERLWAEVLRRQEGPLAWVSTRPADPLQN